jgi:hypothetical protein
MIKSLTNTFNQTVAQRLHFVTPAKPRATYPLLCQPDADIRVERWLNSANLQGPNALVKPRSISLVVADKLSTLKSAIIDSTHPIDKILIGSPPACHPEAEDSSAQRTNPNERRHLASTNRANRDLYAREKVLNSAIIAADNLAPRPSLSNVQLSYALAIAAIHHRGTGKAQRGLTVR